MSRKRMIDPSIWTDEGFTELSITAKLLFVGLVSNADDEGRGAASAKTLKALVFPADDVTAVQVKKALEECAKYMRLRVYEVDGRDYYQLEAWLKHQKIDRPARSKLPAPPVKIDETSTNNTQEDEQDSTNEQEPCVEYSTNIRRALDEPSTQREIGELGEEKENSPLTPAGGTGEGFVQLPTDIENQGPGPKRYQHTATMVNAYFGAWNSKGLPEFRKLLVNIPNSGELLEALSWYRPDEVQAAIEAYAVIQQDPAYEIGFHYQTVVSFLVKGLEAFAPGAKPLERYRAKAGAEAESDDARVARLLAEADEIAEQARRDRQAVAV